jgi:single-stranded DNA-binding protein
MNNVSLVGEVTDRPFRPGNGNRTVVKIKVHGGNAAHVDRFEFDAFGQPGDFAMRLYVGDIVAVTARLEDRTFKEDGEDVNELRIVAQFVQLISKSSDRRAHDSHGGHTPNGDSDE